MYVLCTCQDRTNKFGQMSLSANNGSSTNVKQALKYILVIVLIEFNVLYYRSFKICIEIGSNVVECNNLLEPPIDRTSISIVIILYRTKFWPLESKIDVC